ncbi:MAG: hypothetical protein AAF266_00945 [Planctomycetota bacterium]
MASALDRMLLEKTQRRACRLLFVLGCVLPTLAVAGYTARWLDPGYRTSLLSSAAELLGVGIDCDALTTPRPGVYLLDGVRLSDTLGEPLVTCDTLNLQLEADRWWFVASRVNVIGPEGTSGVLSRLIDSDLAVSGNFRDLRLDASTTLSKGSASLGVDSKGQRRLGLTTEDGVRFDAVRDERSSRVVADCATHTIPAAWLPGRPLQPFDENGSRFSGRFVAELPRDGSAASGAASGHLEVESLATPQLEASHGSVAISDLAWGRGRLVRFFGQLDLRDGQMSRPLVYGACCHLAMEPLGKMEAQYAAPTKHAWFPFTQLACDVELDADGIVLVAGCGEIDGQRRGGAVAHAIVEYEGVALLREPRSKTPLPTQRLVNAWHPDDPAELPATAAAIRMANRLPAASTR